ncbi:MAG: MFS transporter [Clostridia bacterium]|nr:MFS transporter [Clostridia bacterium]
MKNKKMLAFFVACTLFSMACSFAHPVTPTLIVERALDSSVFGTAVAAMQTTMFLFSPFWGQLCSYMPTRKIIFFSTIGYAIGQVIFGAAQNEMMVFAGRIFAGVFTGGCFTAFSNYVINVSDSNSRGANLTTMLTIQTVASACGYFIGGMLGLISVEAAFIAQVILILVCGVLFYTVCVDDTPFKAKPTVPLTLKAANPFSAFAAAKKFMTPMLALVFIIIAVSGIGYNSYEQSFNYFIKDQFNLGSQYNGTIKIIIAGLTMPLNSTVCMYLQKKTDINKTFLPVMVISTTLVGAAICVKSQIPFMAIYIIYNGINAIRSPLLQSIVAGQASKENSNTVMGFYQSMNSLGSIFGALFAGLIYAANPMYPFILAFGAYAIACGVGAIYVRKHSLKAK